MATVENRYAPQHVGADGTGLGGIFDIDSATVRQGFRFTRDRTFTPEAIWIYHAAEAMTARGIRIRFTDGTGADPYQPDLTGGSIRWFPPADSAPGWERIDLEAAGTSLKTTHEAGKVIHVTFERQSGAALSQSTMTSGTFVTYNATLTVGSYITGVTSGVVAILTALDTGAKTFAAQVFYGVPTAGETFRSGSVAGTNEIVNCSFTFTQGSHVRMYTSRSRFPLHYTPESKLLGDAVYDQLNAFMRTADYTNAATPYAQARDNNASFHPLFVVECDDGFHFGNPYDQHIEETIYGSRTATQRVIMPRDLTLTFLAMPTRGTATGGTPDGPLNITIRDSYKQSIVYGPTPLVNPSDRLFVGRTHWFGHWLTAPITLVAGREYTFELSAPLCDLSDAWDGYIVSYDKSTIDPTMRATGYAKRESMFQLDGVFPTLDCDMGIMLRDYATQTTRAVIDELLTPDASAWPAYRASGAAYAINVLSRNIGLTTLSGGAMWSRILDADTGATLSAIQSHADRVQNDENAITHSFTMPAADVHMLIQVGHYEGATPVVDDECLNEVRLIP